MNDAEKKWCNVKLSLILYGKLCAFRVQRYENFSDFSGSQLEDKFSTFAMNPLCKTYGGSRYTLSKKPCKKHMKTNKRLWANLAKQYVEVYGKGNMIYF